MWAVGSFLSPRLTMPGDPFAATTYEMLAGGFVMLPLALGPGPALAVDRARSSRWVYLVTFGSVVGYTAYMWLLANAPLGRSRRTRT